VSPPRTANGRCPAAAATPSSTRDEFTDYERVRDLPKLLPLWEWELATPSAAEHARLLARLRRALRHERQRGLSGDWTYDLARHAQLLRAYRAEVAAHLKAREGAAAAAPSR
jgi:hypothetical protein